MFLYFMCNIVSMLYIHFNIYDMLHLVIFNGINRITFIKLVQIEAWQGETNVDKQSFTPRVPLIYL